MEERPATGAALRAQMHVSDPLQPGTGNVKAGMLMPRTAGTQLTDLHLTIACRAWGPYRSDLDELIIAGG